MRPVFFIFFCSCFLSANINLLKDPFYGYKKEMIDVNKKHEKNKKTETMILTFDYLNTLSVKEYKKLSEEIKEIAVMNPTEKNIFNTLVLKKFQDKKATEFMNKTKLVQMQHPELDIALDVGTSKYERSLQSREEQFKREDFFKKHKDNLGLIIFYKPEDYNSNKALENILNMLEYETKINIRYLDLENEAVKKMIEEKKINVVKAPDIWLFFQDKKAKWLRIGSGIITKDRLIKEIEFLFNNAIKVKNE
jgi:hypothetical protein